MLKAARDHGWEVTGIEAAPKFAAFARDELGLKILEGLVSQVDTDGWSNFDVIAFDVFEHLHDRVSDLKTLRELVGAETQLVITTPYVSSPVARFWGLRWRQILPSHINYSTRASMTSAFRRAGWEVKYYSEPRYWDPNPKRERHQRVVEIAKFLGRWVCYVCIVLPSRRAKALRRIPPLVTRNRLSWDDFMYRVGNQPVLGDVMLVVARPSP